MLKKPQTQDKYGTQISICSNASENISSSVSHSLSSGELCMQTIYLMKHYNDLVEKFYQQILYKQN